MNIYNIRQLLRTKSIYDLELKVVYYARVSTDKEEQKNSIVNQRDHFEEFIRSNKKWEYCGGYIDDGISGIHAEKREEFQRMIMDAKNGKFDLIITKEISRFARNTLDSIQYTRKLLSYGVCVWFQNDNINTIDDDSEFRLTIMAGVAQDEVRKLSSRVRFGHAQAIKNGVVLGNSRLYGYNKENGRLFINDDEAPMIRLIFEKYATGEWSTPKIEKLLWDMGYRNYKGGKISRGVINHIIQNPKYKGWYAGGKVKIIDMFTKQQEFLTEEEWNLYKDDGTRVPAIVDEKTWEMANKYFDLRSKAIKEKRTSFKNDNLFTGKIFCANDGAPYWMKQHYVRGKEDVKWVCSYRIKNGAKSCSSFGLSENELKVMISNVINQSVDGIDHIAEEYINIYRKVILNNADDHASEIEKMEAQIKKIREKMDKILDYNLDGKISDEEFLRRNSEFNEQIKQLEDRIAEISIKPDSESAIEQKLMSISKKIKEFKGIEKTDIDRKVVEYLLDRIDVLPTGERTASIKFYINTGEERSLVYDKDSMGCSEHIFKIMLPEQHTVFYRDLRSFSRHKMPINYSYALSI